MNVTARVANASAQVLAVQSHQLHDRDVTQPHEERHPGIAQVARHRPNNLEVGLLKHIGWVHTAVQAAIDPHLH